MRFPAAGVKRRVAGAPSGGVRTFGRIMDVTTAGPPAMIERDSNELEEGSSHHSDHLQHILKARRAIGSPRTETVRALAEMQAARAELVTSLLGLSDEDLGRDCSEGRELGNLQPRGAKEPEYTIRRIAEHVVEMEEMRLGHIRQALERGGSG